MHGSRPHIVMLFSDQHRADCLGHAGHPLVQTPNMDRMAADGLRFAQADTPCPVCSPARQSLLSGLWPHRHGGICLYNLSESVASISPDELLFPRSLRDAGYRTGFIGKWHVSPTISPADAGYTDHIDDGAYTSYCRQHAVDRGPRQQWTLPPPVPERVPCRSEDFQPVWQTRSAIELLESMLGAEAPCLLSVHLHEPHPPYALSAPWDGMYDPADVAPWPNFRDELAGKPYIQRQMRQHWGVQDWSWDDWAPQVAKSLGAISCVDHCLGMLMDALDRLGIAEQTLLVYSSDHGDLIGAHGMYDKHNVLYEEILRVPLLMRWPGRIGGGTVCDGPVSNCLDLAPTFLELAGCDVPQRMDGSSLLPQLQGEPSGSMDAALSAYHGGQFGLNSQRSLRHDGWKYVFNATDVDELYDLAADPGELRNLAAEPAHRQQLAAMRRRLFKAFDAAHDPLFRWPWMRASFERDDLLG